MQQTAIGEADEGQAPDRRPRRPIRFWLVVPIAVAVVVVPMAAVLIHDWYVDPTRGPEKMADFIARRGERIVAIEYYESYFYAEGEGEPPAVTLTQARHAQLFRRIVTAVSTCRRATHGMGLIAPVGDRWIFTVRRGARRSRQVVVFSMFQEGHVIAFDPQDRGPYYTGPAAEWRGIVSELHHILSEKRS